MDSVIRSPKLSKDARKLLSPRLPVDQSMEVATEDLPIEAMTAATLVKQTSEPVDDNIESVVELERRELISEEELFKLHKQLDDAAMRADSAEKALEELRNQLNNLKLEAHEQGYAVGYEDAKEKVNLDAKDKLSVLREISENALMQCQDMVRTSEDGLVEVVYAAVLRVIGDVLVQPENVATVVRDIAKQIIDAKELTIKLSISDYKMIKDFGIVLFNEAENIGKIKMVPDDKVQLGGCILETEKGSLDARLEVQLARLKQVLLETHARRMQLNKSEKDV